jgi:hypothetical protein
MKAIACILLILSAANCVRSQSTPAKTGLASISGKVTIKGKGVPGFVVVANMQESRGWDRSRYRSTTDETGAYRINLPAGTYQVMPITLAFVLENQSLNTSVMINEGETVENFNFSLVRGGVITGKITDSEGRPLIEETVSLMPVDNVAGNMVYARMSHQTDDRGVYRAFGLVPGKYKVSAGQARSPLMGGPKRIYRQTFYPSVTDVGKATVVEVKEGGEANDVDIVVGRPMTTFTVRGSIVDEAGKPMANVTYGVMRVTEGSQETTTGSTSNARGEFKLDNVLPGKYFVFAANEGRISNVRGDSVSFEVVDHDVNDVVIKASKGSIVSGVVVFEGTEEKPGLNNFTDLFIHAWIQSKKSDFINSSSIGLKPDGSFQISGLKGGAVQFNISQMSRPGVRQLSIVRVERDGIVQPGGVILKDGEVVTGLRLVVKYLTGAIRGQVKLEGSDLVPASRISVWVNPVDDGRGVTRTMSHNSPQVDSRGRFLLEGLAAGMYEVNVGLFDPGTSATTHVYKQQVAVVDNNVSEVVITLTPKP